jgi:hypothetical protein
MPDTTIIQVAADEFCLIPVAAAATGYSEKAIRRKMEEGIWTEGVHYRKAPDGRVFIHMPSVRRWIKGELCGA